MLSVLLILCRRVHPLPRPASNCYLRYLTALLACSMVFVVTVPLIVGKLAIVCMQIALGDKTSVFETTLWLNLCKGKLAGVWGGALPPPQKFFSILSLKMTTFSALWVHCRRRQLFRCGLRALMALIASNSMTGCGILPQSFVLHLKSTLSQRLK